MVDRKPGDRPLSAEERHNIRDRAIAEISARVRGNEYSELLMAGESKGVYNPKIFMAAFPVIDSEGVVGVEVADMFGTFPRQEEEEFLRHVKALTLEGTVFDALTPSSELISAMRELAVKNDPVSLLIFSRGETQVESTHLFYPSRISPASALKEIHESADYVLQRMGLTP